MGNLKDVNLNTVLQQVLANNLRGHILFTHRNNEKKIYFENRFITGSSSNDPADYLGQYLINEGVITLDQFNRAYKTELETEVKMAAVLNLIGLAPVEKLSEALVNKIVDTTFLISCWDDGDYEVHDGYPLQSDTVEVKLNINELKNHHNVRTSEFNNIIQMFNALGEYPEISILDKDITKLRKLDQQIVNLISIGKTLKETFSALPVHFYMISRHLFDLFNNGILLPGKGVPFSQEEIFNNLLSTSGNSVPQEISDISKEEKLDIFRLAEESMSQRNYWKAALYYRVLLNINPHNIVFRDSLNNAEYNYTLQFYKNILSPKTEIFKNQGVGMISDPFEQEIFSLIGKTPLSVRDIVSYFGDKYPEVKILNAIERLYEKRYIIKKSDMKQTPEEIGQ